MGGYLESVILGKERGPAARIIRAALWPLSMLYQAGLSVYLAFYRCGLRRRHRLGVPVISIGNITFGGTGKSPAVATVCRMLQGRGLRVAVLSRGHGGSARGALVVSDGQSVVASAGEAGDEPLMLARQLPGVYVIVGRDRRRTGDLAAAMFNPDVVVLDDGMQYWQLYRDIDIAVVNSDRPFGSGLVMPAGDLREPVSGLRRASVVLVNDSPKSDPARYNVVAAQLQATAPEAAVLRCERVARFFRRADGGESVPLEWANGRRLIAFCGIGHPDAFFLSVESLGAVLEDSLAFPDHHVYDSDDLARVREAKLRSQSSAVVTTEKDIARLPEWPIEDLFALHIELEIEDSDTFEHYLIQTIAAQKEATADAGQAPA